MANTQTSVPVFTSGQVLTAQQQTEINTGIPVFATTVTRDAAFGGSGEKVLAEGQACYVEDTNRIQVYDGANFIPINLGGWTSYTPTVTALSGTFTTVSATGASSQMGKILFVRFVVTVTTNGTAAVGVVITLPQNRSAGTDDNQAIGGARERVVTGNFCQVVTQGISSATIFTSTNGYPGADGAIITGSCFYEVA